jgi:hypothetical protein
VEVDPRSCVQTSPARIDGVSCDGVRCAYGEEVWRSFKYPVIKITHVKTGHAFCRTSLWHFILVNANWQDL